MANLIPLDRTQSIIEQDGIMNLRTQTLMEALAKLSIIRGEGNPEGVVTAEEDRQYRDINGVAGTSILYIKTANDVGGDQTLGWKLV